MTVQDTKKASIASRKARGTDHADQTHAKTAPRIQDDSAASYPKEAPNGMIVITLGGNVVLDVFTNGDTKSAASFCVEAAVLIEKSGYFKRLLGNDSHFAEGQAANKALMENRRKYNAAASIPLDELPRLEIIGIGRTSSLKSVRNLMTDLLLLMHEKDVVTHKAPLVNTVNLAIASDRFDAIACVARHIHQSGSFRRFKTLPKPDSEEVLRQRLLLGLILGDADVVRTYSIELTLTGSCMWLASEPGAPNDALWWELPRRVEEELQFRRCCILQTIWSLIQHCLGLYVSKTRQCRLGYDTSLQCDSFQLGEFIKFLARTSYLEFASVLSDTGAVYTPACDKHMTAIIAELRECPSYQIDQFHSHCGPRKHLLAGLTYVELLLKERGVGICYECLDDRQAIAEPLWSEMKAPLVVSLPFEATHELRTQGGSHRMHHARQNSRSHASEVFLAREKLWRL